MTMTKNLKQFIKDRDYVTDLQRELLEINHAIHGLKSAVNSSKITKREKQRREHVRDKTLKRRADIHDEIKDIISNVPKLKTRYKAHLITAEGVQVDFTIFKSLKSACTRRNKVLDELNDQGLLSAETAATGSPPIDERTFSTTAPKKYKATRL